MGLIEMVFLTGMGLTILLACLGAATGLVTEVRIYSGVSWGTKLMVVAIFTLILTAIATDVSLWVKVVWPHI